MSTQSENSLMKKTKKELVDIILRKDDVEAKLRKEKADIELDFNKAKGMIDKRDVRIDDLEKINKELSSKLESAFTYNKICDSSIKRLKIIRNTFAISAAILLVVIIAIAIF